MKFLRRINANSRAFITVCSVVILGVFYLVVTHAAILAPSFEAETGTTSSGAQVVSNVEASGGRAVKFGGTNTLSQTKVYGINDHPIWLRNAQVTLFNYLVSSGAKAVRIDAPWDVLDGGSKGTYNTFYLGHIDDFVNRAYAANIDVLMIVNNAPQWANGSTDPHLPPANYNDYADYLEFLMKRYAGKVHEFEIWNEPNGGWAWTNPDPIKYAALLKVAYTRAKSIDSNSVILAPSLSGPDQATFLDSFYAQGTKDYFDAFSMHGYWFNLSGSVVNPYYNNSNPNSSIFGAFNTRILPVMQKYGDQQKRVWWTETGIATQGSITSESDQASKVTEAYTAWRAGVVPTMDRLYWYDILDSIGSGSEQNYGLINLTGTSSTAPNDSDLVAKPAFANYQQQTAIPY